MVLINSFDYAVVHTMADAREPTPAPLWRSAFAGSVGGICCTLVGQPFDTIKVRIQTGHAREGLFRGLYSGVASPLVGVTPFWLLSYFSYSGAMKAQERDSGRRAGEPVNIMHAMRAGMVAGLVSGGVVRGFIDNVKGNAQIRGVSALAAARWLFAQNGVRSLGRGVGATTIYSVPTQAVY